MNTKRVGVGRQRDGVDVAGAVADEAAACDVDWRVSHERVDEQTGAGVHRRVTDERTVGHRGGGKRPEERESALVSLEPRRVNLSRDARRDRLAGQINDKHDQSGFVQVHQSFYRILIHLQRSYKNYSQIFTVRRYALHGICYSNSVCPSVCLSVCPSVTLVDCVYMDRPTIMTSSPQGSPIILVSGDITIIPKLEGGHPKRGRWMKVGWVRIGDFRPISRRISETVRDTTKVTINH